MMRAIAEGGYLAVVPEMPFNIAAFRPNTADEIIAEYPDINHWVIGGHSTRYIRIEGGDHHQFGSYEINPEDHLATISRASQQQQIIQATLDILQTVSE